jgi:predicted dehydrogenase
MGIIGFGSRGLGAFGVPLSERADVEIVAVCDPNPVRMKVGIRQLKAAPNCYTSVEKMLASENLDAVVITSPDYTHEENAVAALRRGISIFVDKPLATTVAGCRNVIQAAQKSGKIVFMGFNLRHHEVLRRLKEIVAAGTLGRIFLIENREFYGGGRTYMSRWNRKYAYSGGLWIHKGSHDFDIFNWLLDFPRPARVSSFAGVNVLNADHIPFAVEKGIPVGPSCSVCHYAEICPDIYRVTGEEWGPEAQKVDHYAKDLCMYTSDKDVHDNGIAIVEYENGARASHLECFICSMSDRLYTVVGDRGTAEVSLANRTILIRPRWSAETILHNIPEQAGGHGGADSGLLDTFVKVIKGEEAPKATAEHGLLATAIGQAAEISRREGRTVSVSELMG